MPVGRAEAEGVEKRGTKPFQVGGEAKKYLLLLKERRIAQGTVGKVVSLLITLIWLVVWRGKGLLRKNKVILSWSRPVVLQATPTPSLFCHSLRQLPREVVHSPAEVPTWRGDNPLSLSGDAGRQPQRQVPSHGSAHSCILHARAHTGERPQCDFWHSRACFHQSPVAPAFLLRALCFLKQFW